MEKFKNLIKKAFFSFIWLAVLLFGLDLLSKLLCQAFIPEGTNIWVINNFCGFTLTYNEGMAWGILKGSEGRIFLAIVSAIASAALIIYCIVRWKKIKTFSKAILMVIIAGCVGNLIDRAFMFAYPKGVIDWIIMFPNFPVFNFADACLVVGVIMLVILLIVEEVIAYREKHKNEKKDTSPVLSQDEKMRLENKNKKIVEHESKNKDENSH